MLWDESTPLSSEPANTIHELIQDVKLAVRERFEVNNGTIKEHNASDSDDSGKHPISQVGFTEVVDTWGNRPLTELVEGSLFYVKAPLDKQGLYWIDKDKNYKRFTALKHIVEGQGEETPDHTYLSNTYKDSDNTIIAAHPQYARKDEDFTAQGDLTVGELIVNTVGTEPGSPIDIAHQSQDFYTAHGSESLTGSLISSYGLTDNNVNIQEAEGTDVVTFPEGSFLFLPWTKAPDNTPRAIVIGKDSVRIMNEAMNTFLTDGVTIHIWYIPPGDDPWRGM